MFTNLANELGWTRPLPCKRQQATGNQLAVAENGALPKTPFSAKHDDRRLWGEHKFHFERVGPKKSRLPGHLLPLAATLCHVLSMFSKPADWVRPIFFVLNTYLYIYIILMSIMLAACNQPQEYIITSNLINLRWENHNAGGSQKARTDFPGC